MKRIYLCPSHLDGSERELFLQAYDSNRITTLVPQVNAFKQEICEKTGVRHAFALRISEQLKAGIQYILTYNLLKNVKVIVNWSFSVYKKCKWS